MDSAKEYITRLFPGIEKEAMHIPIAVIAEAYAEYAINLKVEEAKTKIMEIPIIQSNLEHIAKTGKINGSLLVSLRSWVDNIKIRKI